VEKQITAAHLEFRVQDNIGPGSIQQTPIGAGSSGNSGSIVNSSNPAMRNNVQGPPPPYHPTQRSASVPIATQSPNPSSPNNLSLPSPRTAGALGLPSNSPSMELPSTNSTSTSASTTAAASKNCFQTDAGSPSSRHRGANSSSNVMNHHLNSNPTTPLSHLSPKELEPFNQTPNTGNYFSQFDSTDFEILLHTVDKLILHFLRSIPQM